VNTLPSIELSFSGALNNLGALPFSSRICRRRRDGTRAVPAARLSYDYLAVFLIGLVALPVFIAGLNASYQDLFTYPSNTAQ